MGDAWNGTNTDVFVDEIISSKIYESVIWLNWILIISILERLQLIGGNFIHAEEHFADIIWLLLQYWIVS